MNFISPKRKSQIFSLQKEKNPRFFRAILDNPWISFIPFIIFVRAVDFQVEKQPTFLPDDAEIENFLRDQENYLKVLDFVSFNI